VEPMAAGYAVLTRVRQALGDLAGAEEAVREAADLARTRDLSPTAAASLDAARVRLWLAQGNLAACARWAQQRDLQAGAEVPIRRVPEAVVLVRVLLAQGLPDPALALTEGLLRSVQAAGLEGSAIEILALQSLAHLAQGQVCQALTVLEQALAAGQAEGYMRVFVDEGRPMEGLLRQARLRGLLPDYVHRLLAAFGAEAKDDVGLGPHLGPIPEAERTGLVRSTPLPLVEPLSQREIEVLRLVASGRSNREIAAELVLAPSTVKKHVSNIFGKLGVQRRTQCVARARELRLIGE
jgi:LuxR family maltose regulon positive regulatory protein